MNQQLKQRIVGAIVLISVAVIFVPALLDGSKKNVSPLIERKIPQKPNFYFEEIKLPKSIDAGKPPSRIIESKQDVTPPSVKQSVSAAPKTSVVQKTAESSPATSAKSKNPKIVINSPSAWVVQVASLTNSKRALELKGRLKKAGFVAFVEEISNGGKRFYRVRVGPELKQEEAKSLQKRIKQKIKMDSSVMRYHPL
ncbi:MAG: SPOR domain-containing protein [Chromatiales bacterium]|nr:SPOR domain-containing protein [Chromatiales bacterium]